METFTLDPCRWRIAWVFGRNPLLRRADRIEALATLVALIASLVAIPVAGVMVATVYSARDRAHAQETHSRHTVMAAVVNTRGLDQRSGTVVVEATWPAAAGQRSGSFHHSSPVNVGERLEIWIDTDGNLVAPPSSARQAVDDAVAAGMATLIIMGVSITSLTSAVRSRLDRGREAQWESEIQSLQDDGRPEAKDEWPWRSP